MHSYFALLCSFFVLSYEKMARSPWNEAVFSRVGGVFQDKYANLAFSHKQSPPCFLRCYVDSVLFSELLTSPPFKMYDGILPAPVLMSTYRKFLYPT